MKPLFTILFISNVILSFSQSTQLRLTLQSHNEMNDPIAYSNVMTWPQVKTKIAMLVDTLEFYSAKYNLQCESNFIRANIANDNAYNLTSDFLETMENHPLIEVDPHNHLNLNMMDGLSYNPYNYADLAKLLDSCGITRITTVGGYIYQSSQWTYPTDEDWTTYDGGITGNYFPNYTWTPELLWGGGTQNHLNDPFSLGVWRPSGATQTAFRIPTSTGLPNMGNGCSWVIQNTTDIDSLITQLENYTDYFTNHLPADPSMFLCGTVIFNYRYILTPGYVEKVCDFIRKVNPMVLNNRITWQNLGEKFADWSTLHTNPADNYLLFCDDLPSNLDVEENQLIEGVLYPNPTNGKFSIKLNENADLTVSAMNGKICFQSKLIQGTNLVDCQLERGVYFVKIAYSNEQIVMKLIIE